MKIDLVYCFLLVIVGLLISCIAISGATETLFLGPMLFGSLLDEQKLSLSQVAQRLEVNTSTVWRWALKGVRGVKLETFSIGAKRFSTEPALARFSERCTAAASGHPLIEKPRTNRQREAAVSQAEAELDRAGI